MAGTESVWVRAAALADVPSGGCALAHAGGHILALVREGDQVHAVDNRCPHMGFPLDRGSVRDGILTCHWHHARFDVCTGGTFDLWADDVRAFPVEVRDGEVWVDLREDGDPRARHAERLRLGLERDIPLVIGKSVLALLEGDESAAEPFRSGLEFGTHYRRAGWGAGLTILTCLRNVSPWLSAEDRRKALYHGLSAVARDCAGEPPRFGVGPLPGRNADLHKLTRWFRRFVEVRDAEGAERCVVSAVRAGADHRKMAALLFAAATDHRYIDVGHPLDFTNKALEALDAAGWDLAEPVLGSLAVGYASAERMEESNAWRHPIDLVALLESAFGELDGALAAGRGRRAGWRVPEGFEEVLLGDDPQEIVTAMLGSLQGGCPPAELAGLVAEAAALRIARFPTSNEFGDWDTALHTFTFANAVERGLRRAESPELLRGAFDAAMSVYLDRFLNVPAVPLPEVEGADGIPEELLLELESLLDRRGQVDAAAELAARFLYGGRSPQRLAGTLGRLLLHEDRDFHTIQMVEAAFRQSGLGTDGACTRPHVLVAAARYLAAHAPTMRAQEQTWRMALRLHRGDRMFEGESES